jgi:hypothetical protein
MRDTRSSSTRYVSIAARNSGSHSGHWFGPCSGSPIAAAAGSCMIISESLRLGRVTRTTLDVTTVELANPI